MSRTFSANEQYFSLTKNQRTVLSAMAFQQSEQAFDAYPLAVLLDNWQLYSLVHSNRKHLAALLDNWQLYSLHLCQIWGTTLELPIL
jgi:hypothetical protein